MGKILRKVKKCYVCGRVKPYCDFNKNRSRPDGYKEECRLCQKAQRKARSRLPKKLKSNLNHPTIQGVRELQRAQKLEVSIKYAVDRFMRARLFLIKTLAKKYRKQPEKETKYAGIICDTIPSDDEYGASYLDDLGFLSDYQTEGLCVRPDPED
jgi:hypothetical protein